MAHRIDRRRLIPALALILFSSSACLGPMGLGDLIDPNAVEVVPSHALASAPSTTGSKVTAIGWFDDAPNLVARHQDGAIETWGPGAGGLELLNSVAGPTDPMVMSSNARRAVYGHDDGQNTAMAISPDGSKIAVSREGRVVVKAAETGDGLRVLEPSNHTLELNALAISNGGDLAATNVNGDSLFAAAGAADFESGSSSTANTVSFSPGGRAIWGFDTGVVTIADGLAPLASIRVGEPVRHVASAGGIIAIATAANGVYLWDAVVGRAENVGRLVSLDRLASSPTTMVFSTFRELVAIGTETGEVFVFSTHVDGRPPHDPLRTSHVLEALKRAGSLSGTVTEETVSAAGGLTAKRASGAEPPTPLDGIAVPPPPE